MKVSKIALGAAIALAGIGSFGLNAKVEPELPDEFTGYRQTPRSRNKPRVGKSNPLKNYYENHSHLLTVYDTDKNLANKANGKSGFKGFRKVRKFIPSHNHPSHPNQGMSIWVRA